MAQIARLSRLHVLQREFSTSCVYMMPRVVRKNPRALEYDPDGLEESGGGGGGGVEKWTDFLNLKKKSESIDLRVGSSFGNIRQALTYIFVKLPRT